MVDHGAFYQFVKDAYRMAGLWLMLYAPPATINADHQVICPHCLEPIDRFTEDGDVFGVYHPDEVVGTDTDSDNFKYVWHVGQASNDYASESGIWSCSTCFEFFNAPDNTDIDWG